jgi:hypothetical protein
LRLALNDVATLVKAPEHLHVLVLLPLSGIMLSVVGRHLINQREVEDVANAHHQLD